MTHDRWLDFICQKITYQSEDQIFVHSLSKRKQETLKKHPLFIGINVKCNKTFKFQYEYEQRLEAKEEKEKKKFKYKF